MLLDIASDWADYLGHFHPVIVHLPIGILVIAFILEIVTWRNDRSASLDQAIRISLAAGFISAVLACILGWFLSSEGGYPDKTLFLHQWMGIGVAALTGVCWFMKKQYGRLTRATRFYRYLFIFLILLLTATGHYGGNMTHGDDYLTAGIPQPVAGWLGMEEKKDSLIAAKAVSDINEAVVYADLIRPILSSKCYDCHSSVKVKGSLRMDTEDLLFKGGKHGSIIKPFDAAGSEMIKRLSLPMEDDKRMPPKDQPQLNGTEIALLTWWVQKGADTKKKVKELQADSVSMIMLKSFASGSSGGKESEPGLLPPVYDQPVAAAREADLKPLKDLGILLSPVAKNKNLLELSAVNTAGFANADMKLLAKLASQLVWVRLDNTAITDAAMEQIGKLGNLVRLNISGTAITSAGLLKLLPLKNLEYLNVTGTRLDDAGLLALVKITSLKNIYCWNTQVTPTGAEAFRQLRPEVHVDTGDETP